MTARAPGVQGSVESAAELAEDARTALRDLLLALADSKRLLGIRYSDCMLGSPSLESGIAASSMAQDEWGHGRLTYALLSDFGDDPKHLEHAREAVEYHSMERLDRPFDSWPRMIAAALVLDSALSVQFEALASSRYTPARNRVQKLLDEELLHHQYAAGWVHRLARSQVADALVEEVAAMLPDALRWFGPPDADGAAALRREGLVTGTPDDQRAQLLERIAPVLDQVGLAGRIGLRSRGDAWLADTDLSWDGWDDARRRCRSAEEGPDADALARVRGDRNRVMLLD